MCLFGRSAFSVTTASAKDLCRLAVGHHLEEPAANPGDWAWRCGGEMSAPLRSSHHDPDAVVARRPMRRDQERQRRHHTRHDRQVEPRHLTAPSLRPVGRGDGIAGSSARSLGHGRQRKTTIPNKLLEGGAGLVAAVRAPLRRSLNFSGSHAAAAAAAARHAGTERLRPGSRPRRAGPSQRPET